MPELPEVETIRRHLAPHLEGRRIDRLDVLDARWCDPAPPGELADAVEGRRIERLSRRGKYLDWELEDEVHVVMHLRMTGNILLVPAAEDAPERKHLRVRIALDDGNRALFVDPRRFGTGIVLLGDDAREDYFDSRLGVEPLSPDFTAEALRAQAGKRAQPVKAFLLNQERVAGVGNIYADEALFRARIHPLRPVGTLKRTQIADLRDAVVESLEAGIEAKGATIDDFRHPDGASGSFQDRFLIHLREGEPCVRCGRTVKKMRAAGRGTYVCESCQPRPRVRRKPV
jgi:formamidopyrimidine-DNA glycosylase